MASLALLVASAASLASWSWGPAGEIAYAAPGMAVYGDPSAGACCDPDLRFMLHMLVHHEQALTMTALVEDRSESDDVRRLARRIDVSQLDEIEQMRRWLESRLESDHAHDHDCGPGEAHARGGRHEHGHAHHHHGGAHDHHGHAHHHRGDHHAGAARGTAEEDDAEHRHEAGQDSTPGMPGMLSEEQLARLAAATGAEFDRLFLEYMIHHHEGALTMVDELFATDGAAQDTEIFAFASHVAADQRIEIERMRRMLESGP